MVRIYVETVNGTYEVRDVVIDRGTILEDGIEIYDDGVFLNEHVGYSASDINEDNIFNLID